jgi:hypothetical protein
LTKTRREALDIAGKLATGRQGACRMLREHVDGHDGAVNRVHLCHEIK